ncbi:3-phosphoshikimate 1-carboxyvinyltransferase [Turneriella parva]|nr:3-phosphoshikimate 1-carboxyvinyltransferase [Turneriella parva]
MPMRGTLTFPGDKSLSHRAAILATLASGTSTISNFLDAGDTMNTLKAMQALGARVTETGPRSFRIESGGLKTLRSPETVIDCGNSGTGARLIMGLVAGLEGVSAVIDGDASLRKRPMRRVLAPLEKLGAKFEWLSDTDCLPVRIHGTKIHKVEFTETLGSAQVKSAVMLAALASGAELTLTENIPSRDHTENMLRFAGVQVLREGNTIRVPAGQVPAPREYKIWGDISSAAFFAVGASLVPDSELVLRGVLLNPFRDRYLTALKDMGAAIEILPQRDECGEKGGDVMVRSSRLKGIQLPAESIPSLIDEIPVLTIAGAFASGRFSYRDAKELRVKESDRIGIMVKNLQACGVAVTEFDDGLELAGDPQRRLTGTIEPHMDHRIVMSFEVANLAGGGGLKIDGKEWIETSFPSFYEKLQFVTSGKMPDHKKIEVITIDGPAGSGKSTVAYMVAKALGYNQIDSGALYRAFTWAGYEKFRQLGGSGDWATAIEANSGLKTYLSEIPLEISFGSDGRQHVYAAGRELGDELRSPEIASRIKPVADARYLRERVREVLVDAASRFSLVADGRDMGTDVFVDAAYKFFLTADSRTRAARRLAEFQQKQAGITLDEVQAQIEARDRDDENREFGGLRPAHEAIFIDTSSRTQERVADIMLAYIRCARM